MKKYRNTGYVLIIGLFLTCFISSVFAAEEPSFPLCINPQGELIVAYTNGIHGVPADATTYTGSDTVYKQSPEKVMQCLCTVNGQGIQTNWWKKSSISDEEKNALIRDGWTYIPDGAPWGLDPSEYFAKNYAYSCSTSQNSSSSNSTSSSSTSSNSTSSNNSSSSSTSVRSESHAVTAGQVLGLAATGNIVEIVSSYLISLVFILSGMYVYRNYQQSVRS